MTSTDHRDVTGRPGTVHTCSRFKHGGSLYRVIQRKMPFEVAVTSLVDQGRFMVGGSLYSVILRKMLFEFAVTCMKFQIISVKAIIYEK